MLFNILYKKLAHSHLKSTQNSHKAFNKNSPSLQTWLMVSKETTYVSTFEWNMPLTSQFTVSQTFLSKVHNLKVFVCEFQKLKSHLDNCQKSNQDRAPVSRQYN